MHLGGLDMALNKYKLGVLIEPLDMRNYEGTYTLDDVRGISTGKEFIETKANMDGVSLSSYKVVNSQEFAYVADTSRRGEKIAIAFNTGEKAVLISSIYTVFRVARPELLNSEYLFMYFNRPEFDRYARFNSWGSARETFDWDAMCDIDMELPELSVQQKYVDIYKAMLSNQQSYERGLEDLKLVCDGYIEDLRRKIPCEKIGPYIEKVDERNTEELLGVSDVKSVNMDGTFAETVANVDAERIHTYKIVKPNEFAYTNRINIGSIARRIPEEGECLVSASYDVFQITNKEKLMPEYLTLWIRRREFFRSTGFYSVGSVKDNFSVDMMKLLEIPIPNLDIQQSIVNIYESYLSRKKINDQLKYQIKEICPILIRGSLKEENE